MQITHYRFFIISDRSYHNIEYTFCKPNFTIIQNKYDVLKIYSAFSKYSLDFKFLLSDLFNIYSTEVLEQVIATVLSNESQSTLPNPLRI